MELVSEVSKSRVFGNWPSTGGPHLFSQRIDNWVRQGKHAAMRRAWIVAVLVIGAVVVRVYGPKNFWITSGSPIGQTDVRTAIAPLNVVMFWLLIAAALLVIAITALRRRARS